MGKEKDFGQGIYASDENNLEIYLRSNCDLEDHCTLKIYKKE